MPNRIDPVGAKKESYKEALNNRANGSLWSSHEEAS